MTNLDNDFNQIKESDVSFWPSAIRYGLIGGVISIIYSLIGILTGLSDPSKGFLMITVVFLFQIMIWIGIIIFVIRRHRDQDLGGYISIGRAFIVGLIACVISMIITNLFLHVYVEYIDPTYVERVLTDMEDMFMGMDFPEEAVEGMVEGSRDQFKLKTLFTTGLLSTAAISAVISIICSAIMKKEVPQ